MKNGFTIVEMMIVVAILGLLAVFAGPIAMAAYTNSQNNACARNIAEIEKAKAILTLPKGIVIGAMGLDDAEADLSTGDAHTNLLLALSIKDETALKVGNRSIVIGSLKEKARYE